MIKAHPFAAGWAPDSCRRCGKSIYHENHGRNWVDTRKWGVNAPF